MPFTKFMRWSGLILFSLTTLCLFATSLIAHHSMGDTKGYALFQSSFLALCNVLGAWLYYRSPKF